MQWACAEADCSVAGVTERQFLLTIRICSNVFSLMLWCFVRLLVVGVIFHVKIRAASSLRKLEIITNGERVGYHGLRSVAKSILPSSNKAHARTHAHALARSHTHSTCNTHTHTRTHIRAHPHAYAHNNKSQERPAILQ